MLTFLLTFIEDDDDRQRFIKIYNKYYVEMEKVAFRILEEYKDAEDSIQNAWMQVIKNFQKVAAIPSEELL
ncbi:MAG: hypothetical protein VB018_01165 [Lachnospiraceae bacterium]|nr:hypothetical protein [Lachnospiraceae bacterium]